VSAPTGKTREAYNAAEVEAVHVICEDGSTYAAVIAGDAVLAAVEVEDTALELLDTQACDALEAFDDGLAKWLTVELAHGAALVIGCYFEVGA
jgi:hypothetical protein